LHIVVCVKHVPDATDIRFDPITLNLIREGVPSIVNPFCLNAIEEAVRMKERLGATVTALAMGPLQAQEGLREALAMGADQAIMVSDREMAGADTLATSYTLWKSIAKIAERKPFDLILTGKVAIDGETGQVPPGLAVRFDIPIISNVTKIEKIDPASKMVTAKHRFDDGIESVTARLPAVLTMTEEANKPRKFTLEGMLKAKRTQIEVWNKDTIGAESILLGLKGSPTIVKKVFPPPGRKKGETIDGTEDPQQAAQWLMKKLAKTHVFDAVGQAPGNTNAPSPPATPAVNEAQAGGKYGEVWVFVEQFHGKPNPVSWDSSAKGEGYRRSTEQNSEP
jgi:electron transfer flavoprotein beta subunit